MISQIDDSNQCGEQRGDEGIPPHESFVFGREIPSFRDYIFGIHQVSLYLLWGLLRIRKNGIIYGRFYRLFLNKNHMGAGDKPKVVSGPEGQQCKIDAVSRSSQAKLAKLKEELTRLKSVDADVLNADEKEREGAKVKEVVTGVFTELGLNAKAGPATRSLVKKAIESQGLTDFDSYSVEKGFLVLRKNDSDGTKKEIGRVALLPKANLTEGEREEILKRVKYKLGDYSVNDTFRGTATAVEGGADATEHKSMERDRAWCEAKKQAADLLLNIYNNSSRFDGPTRELIERRYDELTTLSTWTKLDPKEFKAEFEDRYPKDAIRGPKGVYNILIAFQRIYNVYGSERDRLIGDTETKLAIKIGRGTDKRDERYARAVKKMTAIVADGGVQVCLPKEPEVPPPPSEPPVAVVATHSAPPKPTEPERPTVEPSPTPPREPEPVVTPPAPPAPIPPTEPAPEPDAQPPAPAEPPVAPRPIPRVPDPAWTSTGTRYVPPPVFVDMGRGAAPILDDPGDEDDLPEPVEPKRKFVPLPVHEIENGSDRPQEPGHPAEPPEAPEAPPAPQPPAPQPTPPEEPQPVPAPAILVDEVRPTGPPPAPEPPPSRYAPNPPPDTRVIDENIESDEGEAQARRAEAIGKKYGITISLLGGQHRWERFDEPLTTIEETMVELEKEKRTSGRPMQFNKQLTISLRIQKDGSVRVSSLASKSGREDIDVDNLTLEEGKRPGDDICLKPLLKSALSLEHIREDYKVDVVFENKKSIKPSDELMQWSSIRAIEKALFSVRNQSRLMRTPPITLRIAESPISPGSQLEMRRGLIEILLGAGDLTEDNVRPIIEKYLDWQDQQEATEREMEDERARRGASAPIPATIPGPQPGDAPSPLPPPGPPSGEIPQMSPEQQLAELQRQSPRIPPAPIRPVPDEFNLPEVKDTEVARQKREIAEKYGVEIQFSWKHDGAGRAQAEYDIEGFAESVAALGEVLAELKPNKDQLGKMVVVLNNNGGGNMINTLYSVSIDVASTTGNSNKMKSVMSQMLRAGIAARRISKSYGTKLTFRNPIEFRGDECIACHNAERLEAAFKVADQVKLAERPPLIPELIIESGVVLTAEKASEIVEDMVLSAVSKEERLQFAGFGEDQAAINNYLNTLWGPHDAHISFLDDPVKGFPRKYEWTKPSAKGLRRAGSVQQQLPEIVKGIRLFASAHKDKVSMPPIILAPLTHLSGNRVMFDKSGKPTLHIGYWESAGTIDRVLEETLRGTEWKEQEKLAQKMISEYKITASTEAIWNNEPVYGEKLVAIDRALERLKPKMDFGSWPEIQLVTYYRMNRGDNASRRDEVRGGKVLLNAFNERNPETLEFELKKLLMKAGAKEKEAPSVAQEGESKLPETSIEQTWVVGDSLALGYSNVLPKNHIPQREIVMNSTGPGRWPIQIGSAIQGAQTGRLLEEMRGALDNKRAAGVKEVVILAGLNNLIGGQKPGRIQKDIEDMCALARSAGMKVVLCTIPSWNTKKYAKASGSTAEVLDARTSDVNDWIRAQASKGAIDGVVDLERKMGRFDTRAKGLVRNPDGVHFQDYKAMAGAVTRDANIVTTKA